MHSFNSYPYMMHILHRNKRMLHRENMLINMSTPNNKSKRNMSTLGRSEVLIITQKLMRQ